MQRHAKEHPLQPEQQHRSFRLVCAPHEQGAVLQLLAAQGVVTEAEPCSPWVRRVVASPLALGSTLAAWFGLLYIQDRASLLAPLALGEHVRGRAVLDICASPGGKSSFLAQLAGPEGFVLANEPNRERHQTLKRNLGRLQLPNAACCQYPGEALPLSDGSWPCILLDPPCSGWGTADKHPNVATLWKEDKVAPLVSLQRALLREAARLLAPGGCMVYSTCTTNVGENEAQVLFAREELGLEPRPLTPPPGFAFEPPQLDDCPGCLRVDQERSQAQGHFVALLHKPGLLPEAPTASEGESPGLPVPPEALVGWDLERLGPGTLRLFGDKAHFLPRHAALLPLGVHWQAYPVGRVVQGHLRPLPRTRLLLPATPRPEDLVVADPRQLQALLTGQSLPAPEATGAGDGLCGLYWQGPEPLGLGWLKRKGRRLLWAER